MQELQIKIHKSVADTQNTIRQMEQVKFTCKMESFQEDAIGAVFINEADMFDDLDPIDMEIRSLVE